LREGSGKGEEEGGRERRGKGKKEEKSREDSQCLKCVDANAVQSVISYNAVIG